jgi:hypothetical protein
MKLKEEIYDIIMSESLEPTVDNLRRTVNKIMKIINKRANKLDVGEMIKTLMWDKRKSLNYGDISEYVEKNIVKLFK